MFALWQQETLLNFLRRVFIIEIVEKSRLKSLITEEKMRKNYFNAYSKDYLSYRGCEK